MTTSAIDNLREKLKADWPAIRRAQEFSQQQQDRLLKELTGPPVDLSEPGYSLVLYGSLSRLEAVQASDTDWVLLIDDQASPGHTVAAHELEKRFSDAGFGKPSAGGAFGQLCFSHDLVHHIGGNHDSNRNLTQRILLLLESTVVGNRQAYDRVILQVLNRYLFEDVPYRAGEHPRLMPRFLLNDVVRYWRTMAVDYANKRQTRRDGWALRNAKLRMSRKLLFVSGLLMCLECSLKLGPDLATALNSDGRNRDDARQKYIEHLRDYVASTPLNILASACIRYAKDETSRMLFDNYEQFLQLIGDTSRRTQLASLEYEAAQTDAEFRTVREIGHRFQEGLNRLCFHDNQDLSRLIMEFGVF